MDKNTKITHNNSFKQSWGLDDDGNSILHVAAARGRLDLLEYFYLDKIHQSDINAQNFMGWTPLMQAARFGHFNCVQFLCKHVDIFMRNKYGLTAISIACAHGDLKIVELLFECMILLDYNLSVIENPISPLTLSTLFGHFELVQFFISKSFNIYHCSIGLGITPFDCAGIIHNKQIRLLLKNLKTMSNSDSLKSGTSRQELGTIPRVSITTASTGSISRHSSNVNEESWSSLDLSPISPVFLDNTFVINRPNSKTLNLSAPLLLNCTRSPKQPFHDVHNNSKQVFFPPDFEIPTLSPVVYNHLKSNSLSPSMKVASPRASPRNTSSKTIITQTKLTTMRHSNGDVVQRITKTYTMEHANSPSHNGCNKMVNTKSNLQSDSKLYQNLFQSKPYQCPNESFYKLLTILQNNGLGTLIPIFLAEEIDYVIFLTLTRQDIIDIGITSTEDQQKILNIISQLMTNS